MDNRNFRFLWIGHAAFIALFIFAALFYLERVIFVDSSYFSFRLIYDKCFHFTPPRVASVVPQILPLIAVWLHLPLKVILFLFSVSYILLYYLIFYITAYVLKEKKLALAIPFVLLLGTQFSFYWCVTESHQANVYAVLLAAFLFYSSKVHQGKKESILTFFIGSLILFLGFFSHPSGFFPLLFVLGYFILDKKSWKDPSPWLLLVVLLVMMISIVFVFSLNAYDSQRYNTLFSFNGNLHKLMRSETLLFILKQLPTIYLFSLVIFISTCVYYILKKEFAKLLYYSGSVVMILIIVSLTFFTEACNFIHEKDINPLNVILIVPFFHEVLFNEMKFRKAQTGFLLIFLVISSLWIILAYPFNRNRLQYIKHLTDLTRKYPERKFLLKINDVDKEKLLMSWALGTESLLLSSIESSDSSRTIYVPGSKEKVFVNTADPDIYICARWAPDLSIRRMDGNWFNLGKTQYKIISARDLLNTGKEVYFENFENQGKVMANYIRDSTGNTYFVFTSEFSPGFKLHYNKLTNAGRIYMEASASVRSFDEAMPKEFGLVISRMNQGQGFEYYHSCLPKPCIISGENWTKLNVSGVIVTKDTNDIVKVYLWNPTKAKVMIDDIRVMLFEDI